MPAYLTCYYTLLIIVDVLSICHWHILSKADKRIAVLIWITTLVELAAFLVQYLHQNNMLVYHIYSPLELLCLSLYFNESVDFFKKNGIGMIIGFLGAVFAAINAVFLQEVTTMNFNFLMLEGAFINVYCLFSFRQIALGGVHNLKRLAQFWITSALLVYWSLTFTGWGMTAIAGEQTSSLFSIFYKVLIAANYLLYVTMAFIFYFYRQLIPSGSQLSAHK